MVLCRKEDDYLSRPIYFTVNNKLQNSEYHTYYLKAVAALQPINSI